MDIKLIFAFIGVWFLGCRDAELKRRDGQIVKSISLQDSLFKQIDNMLTGAIPNGLKEDSLSILILPVEAACPSCRRKTIDSIEKYKLRLNPNAFIVISGTSLKKVNAYFKEEGYQLPQSISNIFIDSTNEAFIQDLVFTKPVIYYAHRHLVYRRVNCNPTTIKDDLREFFKGM